VAAAKGVWRIDAKSKSSPKKPGVLNLSTTAANQFADEMTFTPSVVEY